MTTTAILYLANIVGILILTLGLYFPRHGRRDLTSLLRTLDALDAASLERKRAITLPLLREVLQRDLSC